MGISFGDSDANAIFNDPDLALDLPHETIQSLLEWGINSFRGTPPVVHVHSHQPILVVGDLHGNFESLKKVLTVYHEFQSSYCVFLGDYVDRGESSVEVLNVLLALRQRLGDHLVLLRGNHEDPEIFSTYTFTLELERKHLADLQVTYERLFELLPFACVANDTICCLHGGVPNPVSTLEEIAAEPRLRFQALWNDPAEKLEVVYFAPSSRGPGIYEFGEDAFREYLFQNNFTKLVRAHEWQPSGYRWMFGKDLLSIFTAENYGGRDSPGSVAIIRGQQIKARLL
jgi:serine/threonine-protein phosphatase PP1 catalytic subunit